MCSSIMAQLNDFIFFRIQQSPQHEVTASGTLLKVAHFLDIQVVCINELPEIHSKLCALYL